MSNHLGEYIKAQREELGLGRSEVARLLGYENVNKGSRRLHSVEEGRWISRDFLLRLMGVLQIEPRVVQELIDRDRQEHVAAWEKWADEPVPMSVSVRYIPGFFGGINLPDDVMTPEQAVAFGVETAQRLRKKVVVVVSRRVSYTIHEDGRVDGPFVATPDSSVMPYMALGKQRFLLNIDGSGNVEKNEP
jgi:transcriptional regulator with XRE-family HTH domain